MLLLSGPLSVNVVCDDLPAELLVFNAKPHLTWQDI